MEGDRAEQLLSILANQISASIKETLATHIHDMLPVSRAEPSRSHDAGFPLQKEAVQTVDDSAPPSH